MIVQFRTSRDLLDTMRIGQAQQGSRSTGSRLPNTQWYSGIDGHNGDRTTIRDASGRTQGSASQSGSRTTFRDSSGRTVASANTSGSKSYYLGVYEVTQGQYEKVMGNNPSKFKGAKNPVESSWDDAVSFCKKLSEMPEEKAAGREYRLPTEAEWEYACRANSTISYSFGDTAKSKGEFVWFSENSEGMHHPVGEKKANRWGLYDMHGNVWEWCQDWYASYPTGAATDPQGPIEGANRVFRGGCWLSGAAGCRTARRGADDPARRNILDGFRVALSPSVK